MLNKELLGFIQQKYHLNLYFFSLFSKFSITFATEILIDI